MACGWADAVPRSLHPRQRDREILNGIAPTGPRSYPLRKGETVAEVLKGRGVSTAEAEALNPGLNLRKAKEGTVLKLPNGRYTTREKEMLSSVVPASSLGLGRKLQPSGVQLQLAGAALLLAAAYAFYLRLTSSWAEKDE